MEKTKSRNFLLGVDKDVFLENFKCPICLDYLESPVMELPNQHIFCKKCFCKNNKTPELCPICKQKVLDIIVPRNIVNLLGLINIQCVNKHETEQCNWEGDINSYWKHQKECIVFKKSLENNLASICEQQKLLLNVGINPHLKKEHSEIFEAYVKDWEWLLYDSRDWKWWWWCSNPWWNNTSCEECNNLWHLYEDSVFFFENKRVSILHQLEEFVQDKVESIEEGYKNIKEI